MTSSTDSINLIRQQVTDHGDLAWIRAEIIELLYIGLEEKGPALDDWDKTLFSNAIGALLLNIHSGGQPTYAWLRLCLADVEQAIAPEHLRISRHEALHVSMHEVNFGQLMGALELLGIELTGVQLQA